MSVRPFIVGAIVLTITQVTTVVADNPRTLNEPVPVSTEFFFDNGRDNIASRRHQCSLPECVRLVLEDDPGVIYEPASAEETSNVAKHWCELHRIKQRLGKFNDCKSKVRSDDSQAQLPSTRVRPLGTYTYAVSPAWSQRMGFEDNLLEHFNGGNREVQGLLRQRILPMDLIKDR